MPPDWTPVGGWIRVSGDKQDETNQVRGIIKHCIQHNYWIVCWYILHAKSASKGKQQESLDRAIADTRDGFIKVLVIPDSSRLERRKGKIGTELLNTIAEFVDAGGRVESVEQPALGKMDMSSQVTTFMSGLIDAEKSEIIKRETKWAYDEIDANHAVRNKVPGVWYTIEGDVKKDKHPVPTDLCREYWPQVLKRCIAGDSAATIAAWLDSEGVRTQRGGKWNQGTVLHLIHNPIFCGRRKGWGPDVPLLTDEAVVTVDLWQEAQDTLANRPKRGPVAKTNKSMLAKLKCARCGAPMYRKQIGGRLSRRLTYRCEGQGPQRKGCVNLVPYERLEARVVVSILIRNDKPYQTKEWKEGTNWDAEIADTLQSLQALDRELVKLGIDEYNRRHADLIAQYTDYQQRNETEATSGGWELTDVLNDNGSVMTQGQHFFSLDRDGRREYLKAHDIRAERDDNATDGIRLFIDGEEIKPDARMTALLDIVGDDRIGVRVDSQIPNAAEWQALLSGLAVPGSEAAQLEMITRFRTHSR